MAHIQHDLAFLPAALEVLETPPRPAARWSAYAIIGLLSIALVWSIAGSVDQIAVAQGQIVPRGRVQLIQPLETGIVRAIRVRDGATVRAGDVLIELDPTEAEANKEALKSDLAKARLDAAIALALLSDTPEALFAPPPGLDATLVEAARAQLAGEFEKLKASLAALEAEINEQREQYLAFQLQFLKSDQLLPLHNDRLAGLETLNGKNLVRKPDLYAARQQVIDNRTDNKSSESAMRQAETRIEARRNKQQEQRSSFRADVENRRAEALRKVAGLEQQLRKEERRHDDRSMRSPADGIVTGLTIFTVGGVVTTKDVLMRIVPKDVRLEVEATVLNKDIGFVAAGQAAEIKLETFPFTRYGVIAGTVRQVWRDAIADEKQGLVYKAEIALERQDILVGDRYVPITPGMAVQAEIKTGRRRIIDYFVSPFVKYRDESLRER